MGEMIQKPDTNAVLIAVGQWFLPPLGYLLMGQTKKALLAALIVYVGGFFTCGLLAAANFVFIYDAYLMAQKLERGESIGMNENAVDFLDSIFTD